MYFFGRVGFDLFKVHHLHIFDNLLIGTHFRIKSLMNAAAQVFNVKK